MQYPLEKTTVDTDTHTCNGRGHDQADSESKWIELKSEFWLKLTLCDTSTGYIIIIFFIMGGYGT